MNHYPRHVGDFIRDTVGLSLAERGAYTALLDTYYAQERPIAYAERYRIAGAISKSDRAAVDYVMGRYFAEMPDGWHQKRADLEIECYLDRVELARQAGLASGRTRRKQTLNAGSTNVERRFNERPTENELASSHKPLTKNQEPRTTQHPSDASLPQVQNHSDSPAKKPRGKSAQKSESEAPTTAVWQAYSLAYLNRYGTEPVRNAKVNGQLAQVVARLGGDESPAVAHVFLQSNRGLYVSSRHPVDLLLRDCESLRTEWATGMAMTETQARQADRTAATGNAFGNLINDARNGTDG